MKRPRHQTLLNLAMMAETALTPGRRLRALWLLKKFLSKIHPGELAAHLEVEMHELELDLSDMERNHLKIAGYLFPEDLDNVPEMERMRREQQ